MTRFRTKRARSQAQVTKPQVTTVEARTLLSGWTLSGSWVGQDGHDRVGLSADPEPSGVQDLRINLEGVPSDRTIDFLQIQGYGGGRWAFPSNAYPFNWLADWERAQGSSTISTYFEPYESGPPRSYHVEVRLDDGSTGQAFIDGGPVDVTLRAENAKLAATWIGGLTQLDRVGSDGGAGPDGFQDVRIILSGLATRQTVSEVWLEGPDGQIWSDGRNAQGGAKSIFERDSVDAARGTLDFQPTTNLVGQPLKVHVRYRDGSSDSTTFTGQSVNPRASMSTPLPFPIQWNDFNARWLGQITDASSARGEVRIEASGLRADHEITRAILSDESGGLWSFRSDGQPVQNFDPEAKSLILTRSSDRTQGQLLFTPSQDMQGDHLVIRLTYDDGQTSAISLTGQSTDPGLRFSSPIATTIQAHPGDDLQALAQEFGSIWLAPGEYHLDRPLILSRPVNLLGQEGAMLIFHQPQGESWTSAIQIQRSHTTLNGFAVRFDGPVHWNWDAPTIGQPGVILAADPTDHFLGDSKHDLKIINLDIEAPRSVEAGQESVYSIQFFRAASGEIQGNRIRAGTVHFSGGSWTIENNLHLGPVAGSWAWDAFSGRDLRDTLIRNNRVQPDQEGGRLYRFLVLAQNGDNVLVEGNKVEGVGQLAGESINAPEAFLTESYRLHFEGKPHRISSEGRILQIPTPQGGSAQAGDIVAIVSGEFAGQWRRISQRIDAQTYLLADPLPAGDYAISITDGGFVNQVYRDNTIKLIPNAASTPLVLAGNHFGTQVINNQLFGGDQAFTIFSTATEQPLEWGWSRTPMFDIKIEGNSWTDSLYGGRIGVGHDLAELVGGRVYYTGSLVDNQAIWTADFLDKIKTPVFGLSIQPSNAPTPSILTIGYKGLVDSGETHVDLENLRLLVDDPTNEFVTQTATRAFQVLGGVVNGIKLSNERLPVSVQPLHPADPEPSIFTLALIDDTGLDSKDLVTRDSRLRIEHNDDLKAIQWRYQINGSDWRTLRLASETEREFLPEDLVQGQNEIVTQALNQSGQVVGEGRLQWTHDTISSLATAPRFLGQSRFEVQGQEDEWLHLLENGHQVADRTGSGELKLKQVPVGQTRRYSVSVVDRAGNLSVSSPIEVTFEGDFEIPKPIPRAQWVGQDGSDSVGVKAASKDGKSDARIRITGLNGAASSVTFAEIRRTKPSDRWQYRGSKKTPKAALTPSKDGSSVDLFFQPRKRLAPGQYQVHLQFVDGKTMDFTVAGGKFDPGLKVARRQ